MRFMILVKANADSEAGMLPSSELIAAMGRYNESLIDAGVLLGGDGLQASSKGARINPKPARSPSPTAPSPKPRNFSPAIG